MSKLLINEHPLQVLPSLAVKIGLNEAIFLQQLHYWLEKSKIEKDGKKWVYNSFKDWQEQFPFWSISTLKRIVSNLENWRLIEKFFSVDKNKKKVKHYTIDYEILSVFEKFDELESIKAILSESVKMELSIENVKMKLFEKLKMTFSINTETTKDSENTSEKEAPAPEDEIFESNQQFKPL